MGLAVSDPCDTRSHASAETRMYPATREWPASDGFGEDLTSAVRTGTLCRSLTKPNLFVTMGEKNKKKNNLHF